jgi:hypothetical protein
MVQHRPYGAKCATQRVAKWVSCVGSTLGRTPRPTISEGGGQIVDVSPEDALSMVRAVPPPQTTLLSRSSLSGMTRKDLLIGRDTMFCRDWYAHAIAPTGGDIWSILLSCRGLINDEDRLRSGKIFKTDSDRHSYR